MNIKKLYIDYFKHKNHKVLPGSKLVPDDESILFTNSGMVQFKDIFTGEKEIEYPRVTTSQLCLRVGGKHNDLDNVGYTSRHHTLFEMLGNFSFNDYFKEEVIEYSWEFITSEKYLNLDINKLWVTVHESDYESKEIWQKYISRDRIVMLGDKDNFWQMGDTGPCGPCSEIFYDQGEENFNDIDDVIGGEGDRFLEIWNLVFMQYFKDKDGRLTPLESPCIDTGMGYERIVSIKEGKTNNYHSSLFMPLLNEIGVLINKPYDFNDVQHYSYHVISDHIRSVSFLLNEGLEFEKDGRGYILKKILRRGIRHGYLLGIREPFMYKLVDTLNDLNENVLDVDKIKGIILEEETKFFTSLNIGMKDLKKSLDNIDVSNSDVIFNSNGFLLEKV